MRLGWEEGHRRRRRGESDAVYTARLAAMWRTERGLEAEKEALRRAARFEATGGWRLPGEEPPPPLPLLELVTGWSKASGGPPHHAGVALFGGWRIGDMERRWPRGGGSRGRGGVARVQQSAAGARAGGT